MKIRVFLSPAACAVSFSLGIASPGESADVVSTWSGAVSATWADDANWDNAPGPDVFPNNDGITTYDALINAAGTPYTVMLANDITVEDLTINSADATLELQSSNLTANTGITLTNGLLYFNGGGVLNTNINPGGGSVLFSGSSGNRLDGSALTGDLLLNQPAAHHYLRLQKWCLILRQCDTRHGGWLSGNPQLRTNRHPQCQDREF